MGIAVAAAAPLPLTKYQVTWLPPSATMQSSSAIDVLALPRDLAVVQRRQDGDSRVHAGDYVRDRNARLLRTAAGQAVAFARNAHQPADGLEDESPAGLAGAGAILAIAGDGAIHQPRIERPQALVVQAVALEVADLVVLDDHVALRGKFARDAGCPSGVETSSVSDFLPRLAAA